MYTIITREELNPTVTRLEIAAPQVARKARAGQFVILRASERGERIPLTVADCDRARGTVSIIFQTVGKTTMALKAKRTGEALPDFVGPLGMPAELDGLKKVAVVGGGVGCAVALPIAKQLKEFGADVTSIIGFRNREHVILEKEFRSVSSRLFSVTDDGSFGERGNVCIPLGRLLSDGERFDEVYAAGPLLMMKNVSLATKPYGIKTVASMNPIMIDGTGMCGGCRLSVGGEMKFACVDGPDFDAHLVDFDEAMLRLKTYSEFETQAREKECRLYSEEVR